MFNKQEVKKVKTKIKQLVCMTIAFAASFIITVTAFAEGNLETRDFDFYCGIYGKTSGKGYIRVITDHLFDIHIYKTDKDNCYVVGHDGEGRIGIGANGFYAIFNSVQKCTETGGALPVDDRGWISDFQANGKVVNTGNKKTIYSLNADETFVKATN